MKRISQVLKLLVILAIIPGNIIAESAKQLASSATSGVEQALKRAGLQVSAQPLTEAQSLAQKAKCEDLSLKAQAAYEAANDVGAQLDEELKKEKPNQTKLSDLDKLESKHFASLTNILSDANRADCLKQVDEDIKRLAAHVSESDDDLDVEKHSADLAGSRDIDDGTSKQKSRLHIPLSKGLSASRGSGESSQRDSTTGSYSTK